MNTWVHINIMREALPGQAQYDDGYIVGQRDFARFQPERHFDPNVLHRPSDSWIAGYRSGYRHAERGMQRR